MRILITAGPTREPIDAVRYIGNRSSGRMGAALAQAALHAGHKVTLILGPVTVDMPPQARRIDVETAAQMRAAVVGQFPRHDLLIMAAAVADYRPIKVARGKITRGGRLVIECEPTEDIAAAAGRAKGPHQRTIAFSLESAAGLARTRRKLRDKNADLIVYNPVQTIDSPTIRAVLVWPDGRTERLGCRSKAKLADILIKRAEALFA